MKKLLSLLVLLLLVAGIPGAQAQPVFFPCPQVVNIAASGTTLITAAASTGRIYVCSFGIGASAALTTTLIEGTGATCGSGTVTLATFPFAAAAPVVVVGGSGAPWLNTQTKGDSLCITVSAGTASGFITFAFGP
jgi:hypothetical protein